jgi:hypothetical protein
VAGVARRGAQPAGHRPDELALGIDPVQVRQHQDRPEAVGQLVAQPLAVVRDLPHAGLGQRQLGEVADVADEPQRDLLPGATPARPEHSPTAWRSGPPALR